eukprot:TRINITY_DN905_c0_g1_i1.p1 TRINITY_DN905_c0_g1~~TRINITY_DN905_c0_g1_i1.p1  ORF type:complete len:484 (+),score=71.72 TRINITY_DN905_c0_g1_i1:36-1487(+)
MLCTRGPATRFVARHTPIPATTRAFAVPASVTTHHLADRVPGAPSAKDYGEPRRTPADIKTTTLESGVKVVTVEDGSPFATVGLFVRTGPRFESAEEVGVSHFIRHLAFTRTDTRSPVTVVRDMEKYTNGFACSTTRETISYTAKSLVSNLPATLYMFNDLLSPKLHEYILRDAAIEVLRESAQAESEPNTQFIELLHQEAFRNTGLGRSLYAPTSRVNAITPKIVQGFLDRTFVSQNLAVVAVGAEHDHFVGLVKDVVTALGSGQQNSRKTEYVGGDARVATEADYTRIGIAFKGLAQNDKDAAALAVFSALVGGDARYSRDGPGRGLTTRLYKNVVAKVPAVRAAVALNSNYSDTGLFGIYAEAERNNAKAVGDVLAAELASLRKGGFEAEEVNRAKNRAKSSFYYSCVGNSTGVLNFVGNQAVVSSGSDNKNIIDAYGAQLEAVTPEDVARVAKSVLSSEPTLLVTGQVEDAPIAKAFRS